VTKKEQQQCNTDESAKLQLTYFNIKTH